MSKVAIIAALEREVGPMVRNWRATEREHDGRRFNFFENERAVLVCGGIGAEAARRACEAVIALYQPVLVISAGFAGALTADSHVGDVFVPRRVVDASDGSVVETGIGHGLLVTFAGVAGVARKKKLAQAYGAQAVDMEAAAVARAAGARGIRFVALKGISDAADFEVPRLDNFIAPDGRFRTSRFVVFVLLRPWLWGRLVGLARNSARASKAICTGLKQFDHPSLNDPSTEGVGNMAENSGPGPHLSSAKRY